MVEKAFHIMINLNHFRFNIESFVTSAGYLISRANVTSVPYSQRGTYKCKATEGGTTVERSITIIVRCRKYK